MMKNNKNVLINDIEKEEEEDDDDEDDVPLPGFRFHPTDQELLGFYLRRKVENRGGMSYMELIKHVDIYKYDPWDLIPCSKGLEKEWYFFCKRGRKYKNSTRPNRVTPSGFWKATGIDRTIYSTSHGQEIRRAAGHVIIGLKKSLVFYRGAAGKGTKTDWMMHEFRLPHTTQYHHHQQQTAAEVWTLCRIIKRNNDNNNSNIAKPPKPCSNNISNLESADNQLQLATEEPPLILSFRDPLAGLDQKKKHDLHLDHDHNWNQTHVFDMESSTSTTTTTSNQVNLMNDYYYDCSYNYNINNNSTIKYGNWDIGLSSVYVQSCFASVAPTPPPPPPPPPAAAPDDLHHPNFLA